MTLISNQSIWQQVHWQHASEEEEKATKAWFGPKIKSMILPNFSAVSSTTPIAKKKEPGTVDLIFVGRIHPVKNLHLLLSSLNGLDGQIHLEVYGVIEDKAYFESCEKTTQSLPDSFHVTFHGAVSQDKLHQAYETSHFLVLPSISENYGHAIVESWAHARPVIIGKNTPWKSLTEKNIGITVDTQNEKDLRNSLNIMIEMNDDDYQTMCQLSYDFSQSINSKSGLKIKYGSLFSL